MIQLLRLFEAERIKWHWNWATALAVIAPVSQVLFLFIFYWFLEEPRDPSWSGFPAWYQVNGNAWNLFFMPITVAFIASISWDLEDAAGKRRGLFLQPCSCAAHYAVKLASHLSLMLISQIFFFVFLLTAGLVLRQYVPLLKMGPIHPGMLLHLIGTSLAAVFPLVALHTWVSSNFKGLFATLVLATAGTWATAQLSGSALVYASPWCLATRSVALMEGTQTGTFGITLAALLISLLLALLGILDFRWRGKSFT